ncbi:MAG: AAA family ATPase, partial [Butyrivibrio sp.]|nr:AAA family ATPase [Butyrivibrio sp.]
DIVYLPSPKYPDKPALLIELKYDENIDAAISQIKNKNYPDRLEHYKGHILLVGINYDKEARSDDNAYKHHTCTIEKI